jgi:hypothetical protein
MEGGFQPKPPNEFFDGLDDGGLFTDDRRYGIQQVVSPALLSVVESWSGQSS